MTKGELIETVLLKVSGFKLSTDVDVQRADIRVYLPVAIRDAITAYYWQERNANAQEIQLYGAGSSTATIPFLTSFTVMPQKDEATNKYYINLPKRVQSLPLNRGIEDVYPLQGDWDYVRITSPAELIGLPLVSTFYWYEDQKIWFINLGKPVCDHKVRFVVDVSSLEDDDELFLPPGFENQIIKMMIEHFVPGATDIQPNDSDDRTRANT